LNIKIIIYFWKFKSIYNLGARFFVLQSIRDNSSTYGHLTLQKTMRKLNYILVIILITSSIFTYQTATAQTQFKAIQETFDFKISTWNTEWLSCAINGPTEDELQINNVVAVIKSLNSDIVAIQEVGTSNTYSTIDTLVRRLGNEWAGKMVSSTIDNCAQNQGIIYKKAKVQLVSASLITDGGSLSDWSSGRYPVLYEINLLVGANVVPISLINIHAKAMGDETSYTRRKNASQGLKTLLDGSSYNTKKVILLGDFNDYLLGTQCSTCTPSESPYKNFMDDTANYKCLTPSLYDPAYNSPVIDNIVISNELFDNYKTNSTIRDIAATQSILNYTNTTSDHTPISANFSITVGVPNCQNVTFSETFATSLGNFTQYSVSGDQLWSWRTIYGACVTGYATINNPNEDWLISPAYDLSGKSSATISFNHALNYCLTESDKLNNQTLWVSNNYNSGAPTTATWTQLTIPTMPAGNNWTFVNSGNIKLPTQMLQNNIRFAFKYLSTATVAGTWEMKELILNSDCFATNTPTQTSNPQSILSVMDKKIRINNQLLESASILDITGRILFASPAVQNIEIPIYQPGVYIVRVGNKVDKVIVK
jgi:endonuclease/exonuclease/phosphatase family metal-dependent hydrolase